MGNSSFDALGVTLALGEGILSVFIMCGDDVFNYNLPIDIVFEHSTMRGRLSYAGPDSPSPEGLVEARVRSDDSGFSLEVWSVDDGKLWVWVCGEEELMDIVSTCGNKLSKRKLEKAGVELLEEEDSEESGETLH